SYNQIKTELDVIFASSILNTETFSVLCSNKVDSGTIVAPSPSCTNPSNISTFGDSQIIFGWTSNSLNLLIIISYCLFPRMRCKSNKGKVANLLMVIVL